MFYIQYPVQILFENAFSSINIGFDQFGFSIIIKQWRVFEAYLDNF